MISRSLEYPATVTEKVAEVDGNIYIQDDMEEFADLEAFIQEAATVLIPAI